MTTRWPTATSENLAGLRSFVTYAVVAASFTSTDLPSSVFTVTDSALIFSMVPMTCFLSPCAKAGDATITASKNIMQRSFMVLGSSSSLIAQCVQYIQFAARRNSRKEIPRLVPAATAGRQARNDVLVEA